MLATEDANLLTATEAAKAIAAGRITAEALVRACLARIEAREGDVRAWAHIDAEQALAAARTRDREPRRGLLHGVPVGVKDIIDTADMPTEYGSPIYRGHRPGWNASCVALVRQAGGIILGKTVTAEFAYYHPGETRNPHNLAHTPGGSSSGSAAAVADRMVPLAIGTQTGGSLIRPAAYCGIVGYKPTFDRIDRTGIRPLRELLDTIGVYGRTVEDAALIVGAMTERPLPDFAQAAKAAPRIAFCRTPQWSHAEPATVAAFEGAVSRLGRAGARVTDLTLPKAFDAMDEATNIISAFSIRRALTYEWLNFRDKLSPTLASGLDKAAGWTWEDCQSAQAVAAKCRAMLDDIFADYDVLLTPSAPGEAPRGQESTGSPIFNRTWTHLHVPCVTVPVFRGPNGLPIGAQVIGRRGQDERTLIAAEWLRRALS